MDVDIDSEFDGKLLDQFRSLGTTDRDVLIAEFQSLLGNKLNPESCAFFLDMNNWNLQNAVCSYYDFEQPANSLPSMSFIADVTVGDGESVAPNTTFFKTWRIKNSGIDRWPPGCHLRFCSGDNLSTFDRRMVDALGPGQTIDLDIEMRSPSGVGSYLSLWRMCTATGIYFGEKARHPKHLSIKLDLSITDNGDSTSSRTFLTTVTHGSYHTVTAVTRQSRQLVDSHSSYHIAMAVAEQPQQLLHSHGSYHTVTAVTTQSQQLPHSRSSYYTVTAVIIQSLQLQHFYNYNVDHDVMNLKYNGDHDVIMKVKYNGDHDVIMKVKYNGDHDVIMKYQLYVASPNRLSTSTDIFLVVQCNMARGFILLLLMTLVFFDHQNSVLSSLGCIPEGQYCNDYFADCCGYSKCIMLKKKCLVSHYQPPPPVQQNPALSSKNCIPEGQYCNDYFADCCGYSKCIMLKKKCLVSRYQPPPPDRKN
ncbi:hypothetical protein Btru_020664 [Bulinus truncatus]|nr:hypothetical protein Btru_020664 [Bulinus truncatus]